MVWPKDSQKLNIGTSRVFVSISDQMTQPGTFEERNLLPRFKSFNEVLDISGLLSARTSAVSPEWKMILFLKLSVSFELKHH